MKHDRLYPVALGCYAALAVTTTVVHRLSGRALPLRVLIVATVALLLFSALEIGLRMWQRPFSVPRSGWLAISTGLVAALVTVVLLHLVGVPPPYPRAIAVFAFGVAAYPVVREINEQMLPFPLYCLLWLFTAAGMILWSSGAVSH